jgi:hypothetical protein
MTVLQNIVKSSRFTESVLYPVAPIIGENVARLGLIAGNTTDLGILHVLRHSGPGESSGLAFENFY